MDKSFYNALLKNNTNIQFEVGGIGCDFNDAEFFQQKNPHPSSSRYKIIVHNPPFKKCFYDLKNGIYEPFNQNETFKLFWDIGRVKHFINLINNKEDRKVPYKYFINSIEKLEVLDQKIIIEGACTKIPEMNS
jgi:hypothetical protein